MTDHKYTDEEVIRACECCASSELSCIDCPAGDTPLCGISDKLLLEIVQRQRTEIAEYQKHIDQDIIYVHRVQAEAVKEFAERLKAAFPDRNNPRCTADDVFTLNYIDELVKEMTGGDQMEAEKYANIQETKDT